MLKTTTGTIPNTALMALQASLGGTLQVAEDPGYDAARATFNLSFDQYPAAIVTATNARDVQAAVRFANASNLKIAVKSTGHGVIVPADNALLLVTSRMNRVRVDPVAQTAYVEAGARWLDVLGPAQAAGLAPLLGSSPFVGAVGYTLGGGMGWLARKYGMAADSVNYFEVVTPDGELRRASATENTDLYWALRGGGGGFGIITGMEIRLYPVTEFYGGNLYYPIEQAKAVFQHYREWIKNAPDELTSSIAVMNFPPLPQLPEPLRGQTFAIVRGCYSGSTAEGEALLRHWREWQAPLIDDFAARPFTDIARVSNDPVDPMPAYVTGGWMREITDEAIDTLIEYAAAKTAPAPLVFAEIRHAGGAIGRASDSAFSLRDANHVLEMVGVTPTPEARAALTSYTAAFKRELGSTLTGGLYLNFTEGEEARKGARQGFKQEAFERLQSVKRAIDPADRLSHSYDFS